VRCAPGCCQKIWGFSSSICETIATVAMWDDSTRATASFTWWTWRFACCPCFRHTVKPTGPVALLRVKYLAEMINFLLRKKFRKNFGSVQPTRATALFRPDLFSRHLLLCIYGGLGHCFFRVKVKTIVCLHACSWTWNLPKPMARPAEPLCLQSP
jgi:hypothetical protein